MEFNGAQIHLAFNHLPVLMYPIIFLMLVWAKWQKQEAVFEFACILSIIAGIFAAVAFFSGEGAEAVLKTLPDFPKSLVHEHEESGEAAFVVSVICSVLGLLCLPAVQRIAGFLKSQLVQKWMRIVLTLLVFVLCVLFARVAHQGGVVRHTEIR